MIPFDFQLRTRIVFGPDRVDSLGELASELGARRALVVSDPGIVAAGHANRGIASLDRVGIETHLFDGVTENPTDQNVEAGVAFAKKCRPELIVGLGGGSSMDCAKGINFVYSCGGRIQDYWGTGKASRPLLPMIAVPTTAGTGSEVTRNAVLGSTEHGVKASLRSPLMLPRVALIDPELTYALPPAVTAATGLDALTQLIEPYVSARANPLTDALCVAGIERAAGALRRVFHDGADREARRDMALASLFGGLALANAGLGVVHGFAAPLGGSWKAPHGALCAALLPHGMAANVAALRARAPQHPALQRYAAIARLLTGQNTASAEEGIDWVRALCAELDIPALRSWGVSEADLPGIVEKAARASSMQANPLPLTSEELLAAVSAAR